MWGIIFAVFAIAGLLGILYIVFGFRRFGFIKRLSEKNKLFGGLSILLPVVIIGLLAVWSVVNAVIILIHWLVFWLICDMVAAIIKKSRKKSAQDEQGEEKVSAKPLVKPYYAGIIAIIITVVYMTYGWITAHNVVATGYTVETDKLENGETFRIIQISDSHTGALFDGEKFLEYVAEMQELNPDVVLMTGDLVDDSTSYEDMVLSCEAIASIKSTYGTYYVYGNHDKRYFGNGSYTAEQLKECLIANGVKILEDSHELVANGKIAIIGRKDASVKERHPAIVLKNYISDDMFTVVLDHQPTDYAHEMAMKFDLVLSGHTHGGQLFPIGQISLLFGINDMTYGIDKRGNTTFIVSSGIADWEIPFKTGCISEYVVVDIVGTK